MSAPAPLMVAYANVKIERRETASPEKPEQPPAGWILVKLDGILMYRNEETGEFKPIPRKK